MTVRVIAAGGTIASVAVPGGVGPALSGAQLLERLPASAAADCTVTEVAAAASYATTPELLARIAAAAREAAADPAADGVVVTHGTDTVEEAVWLTHLFTAGRGAPVVFTCAMRHAGELGEDGPRNLADAVAAARDSRARGRGALLCVNGEVHAARWVRKWHATALAAFRSPGHGPVGEVVESQVRFHCGPAREAIAPLAADAGTLVPDVAVVPAHGGLPPEVVDLLVDRGAAGLVLEGTGGGNVHPRFRPAVLRALGRGIPVVVTTRCLTGGLSTRYAGDGAAGDLAAHGAVLCGDLSAGKARLALMVALGRSRDPAAVADWFAELG